MTCFHCSKPALDRCPRCHNGRCAQHGGGERSWPEMAYRKLDLCPTCLSAEQRHARKAGRVAFASSAALLGMATSAFAVMMLGSAIGLGAHLTILLMLTSELAMGGLSAYTADRHLCRWLLERDQRQLESSLPTARLLER